MLNNGVFTRLWNNQQHQFVSNSPISAGARYTKSKDKLELRHKEHNNDPYSLHNNTIDFTQ